MDDVEGLRLEWMAGRNGSGTLTARLNGDALAVDSLNLASAKARENFAKRLCEGCPGVDRQVVDDELLKLAADLTVKREERLPEGDVAEVDASRIVRPERILTPEVSAIGIPMMTHVGERVAGRSDIYVRWPDGKRERRTLGPTLPLPEGGRLFIHPEPGEPTPNMKPG